VVRLPGERAPARSASRLHRARGRTAVLVGLLAFLAAQAALNLAIRNEWVPVRDPVYAEKFELLQPHAGFFAGTGPARSAPRDGPAPTRVLALGSSRTQAGFDVSRFEGRFGGRVEAFNFGCPAAGPMTTALYFRRLLDAGVRPDYLLVELHPCFATPHEPPFESRWLHPYRLRPGEPQVLRSFGWDVADPPHHGPQGYLTAASAFRFGLLNWYAPVLMPCPYGLTVGVRSDRHGYVPGIDPRPEDRPKLLGRTFQQYAPVLDDYHVGGPGAAGVRDVLALCCKHSIRAAVVLMPESSEFRGWYGPDGYAAVTAFVRDLSREFGAAVFDAREWVPDDGFADGHHLVPTGADEFTDRLAAASGRWLATSGKTEDEQR
jgi:hypothetical protein